MPTPRTAVSNGIPAAISDPKVIVSTKKATKTPIRSVSADAGAGAGVHVAAERDGVLGPGRWLGRLLDLGDGVSGRSVTDTSNWIWDWAYCLFVEMVPTAPEANGSSTLLTCLTFSIALIVVLDRRLRGR